MCEYLRYPSPADPQSPRKFRPRQPRLAVEHLLQLACALQGGEPRFCRFVALALCSLLKSQYLERPTPRSVFVRLGDGGADGRAVGSREVGQIPAPGCTVRARNWSRRVARAARGMGLVPVVDKLPHIACHVVKPPGVGRLASYWMWADAATIQRAATAVRHIAICRLPGNLVERRVRSPSTLLRVVGAVIVGRCRPGAIGVLPLGFRWQAVAFAACLA